MSRWVTFYYDMIREHVSDLKIHKDRETALKYFNKHRKDYFEINTYFKADKLPASYGVLFRKYFGVSAKQFKKEFGISVDEALKIANGEKEVKNDTK